MSEMLNRLYRGMYYIRRVEEVIAELYPQQMMRCPIHLCIGQEGAPVGVCAHLRPTDYVFSTHRSHGHYLAQGGSLEGLLGELYGRETGCSLGKGGSMHLIDVACGFLGAAPILGATIALATGSALGVKMRKERRVTVAFFGDAAVEEGIFSEVASFAVLKELPVLFVCENNGLSTVSPLSVRQPAGRTICDLVRGIGMRAEAGDGNNVLAVWNLARQAVDAVREGAGPMFLEFHTYRIREHCGPGYDYQLGYRTEAEVRQQENNCPLKRLKLHMEQTSEWNSAIIDRMMQDVNLEIQRAVNRAQAAPFPSAEMLLEQEYAP